MRNHTFLYPCEDRHILTVMFMFLLWKNSVSDVTYRIETYLPEGDTESSHADV